MADLLEEQASHGKIAHRLGYVDALLVIAHEAPPSNETIRRFSRLPSVTAAP